MTIHDARNLVAELAAVGGDVDAVRDLLLAEVEAHEGDRDNLLILLAQAMHVVFAECLPGPAATPYLPTTDAGTDGRNTP